MNTARTLALVVASVATIGCASADRASAPCAQARYWPGVGGQPDRVVLPGEDDLQVFVDGAETPMAGSMQRGEHGSAFVPAFALTPGLRYQVQGRRCRDTIEPPPPAREGQPRVVDIFPRSPSLPENVLRFYVYFSEPMAEGNFLDHIELEHVGSGQDITGVFFDNVHELWSADRTRITLLVDPGRVKTGLTAHREMGRAFATGESYRLKIRDSWTSIDGRALASSFDKRFVVTAEDRGPVVPSQWVVQRPVSGDRTPLHVEFGEPVDHVAVHRFVTVRSAEGRRIPGTWALDPDDAGASWTPDGPWSTAGEHHRLQIDSRFEDVSGNNLTAAFDQAMGSEAEPAPAVEQLELVF